jgi:hypothetical protein
MAFTTEKGFNNVELPLAGGVYGNFNDIQTRFAEAPLAAGVAVAKGTGDNGVVALTANDQVFEGITVQTYTNENSTSNTVVTETGDAIGVLTKGFVYMAVDPAITVATATKAYIKPSTNGLQLTNTVGTDNIFIGYFRSKKMANNICRVEVNLALAQI